MQPEEWARELAIILNVHTSEMNICVDSPLLSADSHGPPVTLYYCNCCLSSPYSYVVLRTVAGARVRRQSGDPANAGSGSGSHFVPGSCHLNWMSSFPPGLYGFHVSDYSESLHSLTVQ